MKPTADNPWTSYPLIVLDVETSGLDPEKDRVLELAAVLWTPQEGAEGVHRLSWSELVLPEPGFVVPDDAAEIHGVTTERIATEGRPFAESWRKVLDAARDLGAIGCAYNVRFDRAFLRAEHARAGLGQDDVPITFRWPWLDPLIWVREIDRFVKGTGRHKLATTCERWGLGVSPDHTAIADANAALRLMRCPKMRSEIIRQAPRRSDGGADPDLDVVLRRQSVLGAAQEDRHRDFVRKAPAASICRSCGALLTWAETEQGKRIPLDREPVEGGNVVVNERGIARALAAGEEHAGLRFVSHFATCPNAAQHRTPARQPLLPLDRTEGETLGIDVPPMHDGEGDA